MLVILRVLATKFFTASNAVDGFFDIVDFLDQQAELGGAVLGGDQAGLRVFTHFLGRFCHMADADGQFFHRGGGTGGGLALLVGSGQHLLGGFGQLAGHAIGFFRALLDVADGLHQLLAHIGQRGDHLGGFVLAVRLQLDAQIAGGHFARGLYGAVQRAGDGAGQQPAYQRGRDQADGGDGQRGGGAHGGGAGLRVLAAVLSPVRQRLAQRFHLLFQLVDQRTVLVDHEGFGLLVLVGHGQRHQLFSGRVQRFLSLAHVFEQGGGSGHGRKLGEVVFQRFFGVVEGLDGLVGLRLDLGHLGWIGFNDQIARADALLLQVVVQLSDYQQGFQPVVGNVLHAVADGGESVEHDHTHDQHQGDQRAEGEGESLSNAQVFHQFVP
ncbi:hypothetical protein JOS77_25650 [Chromobacterium haemolyticum]|nr:hypothetical protein JOS77_25650 [Chromobacterium haemolyticum]